MRLALVFLSLATGLSAQVTSDPGILRERLEGKLAASFLRQAAWHDDLQAAQRAAARSGKLIFCHFTRSFIPCGTSIRCEREILASGAFVKFARDVELFCHVTAHVDKKADRLLFQSGGAGWPHHVVMDATGRVLARHTGEKSVDSFRKMLANAKKFLAVERDTEAKIAAAKRRKFEAGMAAGALTLAEARHLFAGLGTLNADQLKRYGSALTELEIRTIAGRVDRFDDSTHKAVGRHFYTMHRTGQLPTSRDTRRDYWGGLLAYLESRDEPDLELYAKGLGALEAEFGKSRGYKRFLAAKRKKLKELQSKATKAKRKSIAHN